MIAGLDCSAGAEPAAGSPSTSINCVSHARCLELNPITVLSGGNQQKVVLARWLAASPRVILLNDPTRGVDLNAKRDLYALLEQLTSGGVGVVMLSTELDEHVELMDRVIVFHDSAVSASLLQRTSEPRATRRSIFLAGEGGQDRCVSACSRP